MSDSEKAFVEVNGTKVWFERIGCGPNVVLLIPGPIGTTRTDFPEIVDGEDELDYDKFTAIAVDPIGTGKSRPPLRQFNKDVYDNDCDAYCKIMQKLEIKKFSIIGCSEGAKVALLMAAKYRQSVESLVLVSVFNQLSNRGLSAMLAKKSVDSWHKDRLKHYLKVYGTTDELQKLWSRYIKFVEFYNQYIPDDVLKNKYKLIACPVLIVTGEKDQVVEVEQCTKLSKLLPLAKVHKLPNGDHWDTLYRYSDRLSEIAQQHILNRHLFKVENEEMYVNSYDNTGQVDCYTVGYDKPAKGQSVYD